MKTIEDGIHTADIYDSSVSKCLVGTQGFADAVIARIGQKPNKFPAVDYANGNKDFDINISETRPALKELIGVDIFLQYKDRDPERLAHELKDIEASGMELRMITNRGTKVWPNGFPETFCTDHWRCRFTREPQQGVSYQAVIDLLQRIHHRDLDIIKTENLYLMDGKQSFSAGQGQ